MRKIIPKDAVLIPDDAKRVFDGVIYDVYQWEQPSFSDATMVFEMLKRPDTVSVICVTDEGILVLDDEQPHRGKRVTLPGGRVDEEDETTLSAAQREVKEETGYSFAKWRLVSAFQPQPKLEWFIHIYLAWEATHKGDTNHDDGEKIDVSVKSFQEAKQMIENRAGFLGENQELFEQADSIEQLLHLPEYKGQEVDR